MIQALETNDYSILGERTMNLREQNYEHNPQNIKLNCIKYTREIL